MVFSLGSVSQFQGFGGLGVYWGISRRKKTRFLFPTTKGSMNACMELGYSVSNKVKNYCDKATAQLFNPGVAKVLLRNLDGRINIFYRVQ